MVETENQEFVYAGSIFSNKSNLLTENNLKSDKKSDENVKMRCQSARGRGGGANE